MQNDQVFELVDHQRKAAVRYLLAIVLPVFLALLSFVFAPGLTDFSVRGVPLPWILLGPATLFSIVLIAWRHDRNSLRTEREWTAERRRDEP